MSVDGLAPASAAGRLRVLTALTFATATTYGIWRVEWFEVFRGASQPATPGSVRRLCWCSWIRRLVPGHARRAPHSLEPTAADVGRLGEARSDLRLESSHTSARRHLWSVRVHRRRPARRRPFRTPPGSGAGVTPPQRASVRAGDPGPERDLEQADASVSVERAQADAGRSREGATGFGPATTAAVARGADLRRVATDFSWSAVYRLAEVERGGNARAASGHLRLQSAGVRRSTASYASYFTPSLSRTACGAPSHCAGTLPW